ncbi:putative anthranilate synthase component I [Collimonas fungivorans]|uniref:Putative anthranilate synthase component I n=2 Tax=Collimonas fungivorans TaxID=158899 RepID=A0A127P9N6_9BURK|nr:putative anthranilate synthase component I [Collimonas fungivorans]
MAYATGRIKNQLTWYAKKAAFNRRTSNGFFWVLIATNGAAILCAILRIKLVEIPFWPTDVFVAAAASLLSWMQAKRFSELAASYALAAHEISLIREQASLPNSDTEFSLFVGDAENAFSREHTQWVARKDV